MSWLEKGYEERFNPGVLIRPGFDLFAQTRAFRISCTVPASGIERAFHDLVGSEFAENKSGVTGK